MQEERAQQRRARQHRLSSWRRNPLLRAEVAEEARVQRQQREAAYREWRRQYINNKMDEDFEYVAKSLDQGNRGLRYWWLKYQRWAMPDYITFSFSDVLPGGFTLTRTGRLYGSLSGSGGWQPDADITSEIPEISLKFGHLPPGRQDDDITNFPNGWGGSLSGTYRFAAVGVAKSGFTSLDPSTWAVEYGVSSHRSGGSASVGHAKLLEDFGHDLW